jgi:hypothetical protein
MSDVIIEQNGRLYQVSESSWEEIDRYQLALTTDSRPLGVSFFPFKAKIPGLCFADDEKCVWIRTGVWLGSKCELFPEDWRESVKDTIVTLRSDLKPEIESRSIKWQNP